MESANRVDARSGASRESIKRGKALRSSLIGLPGFQVESVHQKEVAGPSVPAAAVHAANKAHLLGVHVSLHRVDEVIADVDVDHPADLERRARSERQASDAAAFEADRRLRNPRRADADRGHWGQRGLVELAGPRRKI